MPTYERGQAKVAEQDQLAAPSAAALETGQLPFQLGDAGQGGVELPAKGLNFSFFLAASHKRALYLPTEGLLGSSGAPEFPHDHLTSWHNGPLSERFIRDHAAEAARGWDALELLRAA